MLTFLHKQKADNWELTEIADKKVIFRPIACEDPTAAIEFLPRIDKPEKAYALFKGKNIHPAGQELFFQKEIEPGSYLGVAASMYEMMFLDEGGFDL
jgi:hypothetical protein